MVAEIDIISQFYCIVESRHLNKILFIKLSRSSPVCLQSWRERKQIKRCLLEKKKYC